MNKGVGNYDVDETIMSSLTLDDLRKMSQTNRYYEQLYESKAFKNKRMQIHTKVTNIINASTLDQGVILQPYFNSTTFKELRILSDKLKIHYFDDDDEDANHNIFDNHYLYDIRILTIDGYNVIIRLGRSEILSFYGSMNDDFTTLHPTKNQLYELLFQLFYNQYLLNT